MGVVGNVGGGCGCGPGCPIKQYAICDIKLPPTVGAVAAVGAGKYGFIDVVGRAGGGNGCGPGCPV